MNQFMRRLDRAIKAASITTQYVEILSDGKAKTVTIDEAIGLALGLRVRTEKPVKIIGENFELFNAVLDSITPDDPFEVTAPPHHYDSFSSDPQLREIQIREANRTSIHG